MQGPLFCAVTNDPGISIPPSDAVAKHSPMPFLLPAPAAPGSVRPEGVSDGQGRGGRPGPHAGRRAAHYQGTWAGSAGVASGRSADTAGTLPRFAGRAGRAYVLDVGDPCTLFSPPPSTPAAQIKFSTKSFGDEAAAVAAKAIERMADSLTHADMADIIAGRPGAQAVRGQTECEFCRCRLDREGGPAPSRCWAVFELQTVPCPALGRHELGGISHSPANFPRSPNPRSRRPMPQRRRRCERCGPSPPRSPRPPWWSWTCPTTRWARRASEPRPPPLSAR